MVHELMVSPNEPIVDFENPPVAEVALSAQIQAPSLDTSTLLSAFWPTISNEYPRIVPQPMAPPMEETFEIPSQQTIAFQLLGDAQAWLMVSEDEHEMVHVQPGRFGYAWRKGESDAAYPRYGHVRDRFAAGLTAYADAARGSVVASFCEISYENPIFQPEGERRPDLSTLLTRVVPQEFSVLPRPYNSGLSERFQLERDGEPYARFFIEVVSTVKQPRQLGYTITLGMRGRPVSADLDGVLEFFDEGRERIVTTFRDITMPEYHQEWGLEA
jgi:uncharacterized protein (TIGR04255 family)